MKRPLLSVLIVVFYGIVFWSIFWIPVGMLMDRKINLIQCQNVVYLFWPIWAFVVGPMIVWILYKINEDHPNPEAEGGSK